MPTESKSPIDQFEQKFQCMVHELRNDTDWVNLKRTIVRAPQILKEKFKATEKTQTDEEYSTAYEQFQVVDEGLGVLEKNILSSLYHFKQMLDHSIAMCDAMSKVFDPNLVSSITTDANDDGAVKNGYNKLVAVTRFASKLREIQANTVPNLELIINNVREPVTKILAISKNIKKSVKEREFALLDMNRYADHLSTLNGKDKSTLTLKQGQNIIRYHKNLELATLKFQQIKESFKKDMPHFTQPSRQYLPMGYLGHRVFPRSELHHLPSLCQPVMLLRDYRCWSAKLPHGDAGSGELSTSGFPIWALPRAVTQKLRATSVMELPTENSATKDNTNQPSPSTSTTQRIKLPLLPPNAKPLHIVVCILDNHTLFVFWTIIRCLEIILCRTTC